MWYIKGWTLLDFSFSLSLLLCFPYLCHGIEICTNPSPMLVGTVTTSSLPNSGCVLTPHGFCFFLMGVMQFQSHMILWKSCKEKAALYFSCQVVLGYSIMHWHLSGKPRWRIFPMCVVFQTVLGLEVLWKQRVLVTEQF